jgi:hypothetical protein
MSSQKDRKIQKENTQDLSINEETNTKGENVHRAVPELFALVLFVINFYPGSRKPRPLAVDECQLLAGMSPHQGVRQVPQALPLGLHYYGGLCFHFDSV